MRILLKVPPTGYVEPLRSGLTHHRIPEVPALRLVVSAMVPLPTDVTAWRVRELPPVPDECVAPARAPRTDLDPERRRQLLAILATARAGAAVASGVWGGLAAPEGKARA